MTHVASLGNSEIRYIQVYSAGILLGKTNQRPSKCVDCAHVLDPGDGVYRRAYRASGFLCQDCLAKFLTISTSVAKGDGDAGFRFNPLCGWFVACTLGPRQYTTSEVIEAISRRSL